MKKFRTLGIWLLLGIIFSFFTTREHYLTTLAFLETYAFAIWLIIYGDKKER